MSVLKLNNLDNISYWTDMYSKPNAFGTGPTKLAEMALKLMKELSVQNILEIGCGQGRDAIYFSKHGYTVETFDFSESAINFVNKTKQMLNLNNINAIKHDVREIFPYENSYFDFIYSNLALQFFSIDVLIKIFDNIERVMKRNGTIIFSTKRKGDKYYNFGNKITENEFEYKGIHRYFFDEIELKNFLEKKFKIISFESDSHINENSTVSNWWKIQLKKVKSDQ